MSGPDDDNWGDVLDEGEGGAAEPGNAADAAPEPAEPADATPASSPAGDGQGTAEEAMRVAEDACREIMRCSGFDVRVLAVTGDPVRVEIQGPDAGRIIGRRGVTLQALQYLVARIVGQRVSRHIRVKVDVEGYRVRRENVLRGLAQRAADRVVRDGRAIELDPMSPEERRVVHITLADDGDVRTESIGEGDDRRVRIIPVDDEEPGGGPTPEAGAEPDAGA
ncbi:MAG: KH domain-containing protein [Deltaproteobacteria bacterium]|nr:KH domain-containing protein [Deltaproteobacteria bacterium]